MTINSRFYFLALIFLASCVENLNTVRSGGFVNYHGQGVSCLHFETRSDLKPFLAYMERDFGQIKHADSTGSNLVLNFRNSRTKLSKDELDIELNIINIFELDNSRRRYDNTLVSIAVFKGTRNLVDTDSLVFVIEYLQNAVDESLTLQH